MLSEKHKISPERYKYDAPYLGFALCCNTQPKVDFNPNEANAKYHVGHMSCPVCNKQVGVIANGVGELPDRVGFLYQNWNRHSPKAPLFNMPEGFDWYDVRVSYRPHGSTVEAHKYFMILKFEGLKVFNYCLYRNQVVELEFLKRGMNARFYTSNISSTDGTNWSSADFICHSEKWKKLLEKFLVVSLEPKSRW